MDKEVIVFIGNFNLKELNAAGKRVQGLADAISNQYEVAFIGCHNSINYEDFKRNDLRAYYPYPSNILSRCKIDKYYKFTVNNLKKIKKIKAIIVYGSPIFSIFPYRLRKWCKKNNIVFISDKSDMIFSTGYNGIYDMIKNIDVRFFNRFVAVKSNGIIAISHKISDYFLEKNCRNIVIVPPVTKKNYKNNIFRKEDPESIKIVYAGVPFNQVRNISTHQMKDRLDWAIEQLISVSKNSAINLSFDIYGITREDYLYSIPKHKDLLKNNNIVRFHGKVTHDIIEECIKNADFTIICREKNLVTDAGFPTKFTESMCLGTPVITTDTSDLDRYIVEGKNAVKIDYGFKNSNIEKLTQLFLDRKKISEMKQYTNAHYCFDPRLYSEDIINLIKNVQMR
ncbi:glycosyltransferase [Enterococcus cecorum]|uniref:Glycosyltransferase n=1 Tax=Enterococcus cecorum TaxID=44008 RepID=A0AAW8TVG8_9ENTE|nr:glycosyltransferase [Enterococcus cecorum]MDT2797547.1 glycosyltransferase [Enterococcus cecorum]